MTKEQLLLEYDRVVDSVEDAAATQMWRWADWLADNVPPSKGGAAMHRSNRRPEAAVTLAELAERRGHHVSHLQRLRKTAEATRAERLDGVSVRAYLAALEATGWSLDDANERLREKGTTLRAQAGQMMSSAALVEEVEKLPDDELERVAGAVEAEHVRRKVYGGGKRPKKKKVERETRAERAERKRNDPKRAVRALGVRIGAVRAETRALVEEWQDFSALVEDDEYREAARERLVQLQADVYLAFEQMLAGDIDAAFARLTAGGQ